MRTQKFNHMQGGKILGAVMALFTLVLIILGIMLLIEKNIAFLSIMMLLLATGSIVWVAYKFYKPAFTEVIFSDGGIISKTHFEKEELTLEDIKGIWYYKNVPNQNLEIKPYHPGDKLIKGCIVIIGDLDYFDDAEYIGLGGGGATILRDSFWTGYTTIHYRRDLEPILDYYYQIIQVRQNSPS